MKATPEQSLAQVLRERREEAGLSQVELAEQAGVHQTAVSHWESNRGTKSLLRAFRLASILKLRPADFL
jgi:transcriptional regulator with XRE-family HTH domain